MTAPPEARATNRGAPARPPRPRSRARRLLRGLSLVLIVAGVLLVTDAILTVVWQEPISAYFTQRTQNRLSKDFGRLTEQPPTPAERTALANLTDERRLIAYFAHSLRDRAKEGQAIGRIRIPRIGAKYVVVKGTAADDLRKGPGMYDGQPYPGEGGTAAIAGHRTTYLAPFRDVDQLRKGDRITLTMPYATLTYAVEGTRIVVPSDLGVLRDVGRERLVLSACHPKFSASHRIVVFARLVREQPGPVIAKFGEPGGGHMSNHLKAGPPSGR